MKSSQREIKEFQHEVFDFISHNIAAKNLRKRFLNFSIEIDYINKNFLFSLFFFFSFCLSSLFHIFVHFSLLFDSVFTLPFRRRAVFSTITMLRFIALIGAVLPVFLKISFGVDISQL